MTSHAAAIDRQTLADALLRCGPWYCTSDDDALITHAEAQADQISRIRWKAGESDAYLSGERRVLSHGLAMPDAESVQGQLARMCCPMWWRRQLRRLNGRRLEQRQRILGRVHDRAGVYVSDEGYARRRDQHTRNARLLEAVTATNQEGQEYTLAELAEVGLANPNNRRAELMLRIADTEREAQRLGHVGVFLTITCPSRYHAVWKGTARHNGKWEGAERPDPRQAQAYLQKLWSRARAKLGRKHLGVYGLRVVEPHHDGCPHWHLLLWCEPQNVGAVLGLLRAYALADSPGEVSRDESVRFDAKIIDTTGGRSAAGYVAKYVSKNINGEQFARLGKDGDHLDHETGHDLKSAAPRIEAWAATWGIRQFQFFGLPSVTVWRELRRLRGAEDMQQWLEERDPDEAAVMLLDDMRRACDAGQWAEFVRLMGGPTARRDEQPVKPWRIERLAQEGRYGDAIEAPLGVVVLGFECLTRHYLWTTQRTGTPAEAVTGNGAAPRPLGRAFDVDTGKSVQLATPPTLEGLGGFSPLPLTLRAFGAPWTRVNNCTRPLGAALFEGLREERTQRKLRQVREWRGKQYPALKPTRPEDVAAIRQQTAIDLWHYEIASIERRERDAERRRWAEYKRQADDYFISALARGEITESEALEGLRA